MDLLSKAEFEAGFGSHTPIYTGQTKYAPNLKGCAPKPCSGTLHVFYNPRPHAHLIVSMLQRFLQLSTWRNARYQPGSQRRHTFLLTETITCVIVVVRDSKLLSGCRCVRYYMNFERAMALMKEVLLERGHAINSQDAPGASHHLPSVNDTHWGM